MKDSIVNELITAMKDRLPPGQNLANFLTDTLCIGRGVCTADKASCKQASC